MCRAHLQQLSHDTHIPEYHSALHVTVSDRDGSDGVFHRSPTVKVTHVLLGETDSGDTQRQGGTAMLKDILPCPFGLGPEIDIFQSDEALM